MARPAADLVVESRRVVTPEGVREAAVVIAGGRIREVVPRRSAPPAVRGLDASDHVVLPGLVDAHVHINEPGRTEWEGFESATRAAAAGGVTTLVDMPLNSIPATTSVAGLHAKRAAAEGRLHVDCAFWGGVVPGNTAELEPLLKSGVAGCKAFLVPSGVDEFAHVTEADLRAAMPVLARHGAPLLVHAELQAPAPEGGDPRLYATYLASRPAAWENEAVRLLLRLVRETGCPVHIVHLSSAEALPLLAGARREGLPVTVETCPHYLHFAAEDVPAGRTDYKCSPPIRSRANRERLWQGLGEGTIDMIVSDHSPCAPELKGLDRGDFLRAWGGIASLQFRLPVVFTDGQARGLGFEDLARLLCERPADLAGLHGRKGALVPGADADLVVLDPRGEFEVSPESIRHRHPVTPYAGQVLRGAVVETILRGRSVYERGRASPPPQGQALAVERRLGRTH